MKSPNSCKRYETCSANLCSLDHGLKLRDWIPGEDVCKSQTWGRTRWIRKQRTLNRHTPKKWIGENMFLHDLLSISRPQNLTSEQRRARSEQAKKNMKKMWGKK